MKDLSFAFFGIIAITLLAGLALIDSREITGMQTADNEKTSMPQIMENIPAYAPEVKFPNAPGISFDKVEIKCGLNTVGGDAKEGYWTKNFCQAKKENIFNFDSSKDGEDRAKSLCEKNKVKEKIKELYNSIKCPSSCPIKKQTREGDSVTSCNSGIFFGSTIHCNSKIFFNCEAKSVKQVPPEIQQIIKVMSESSGDLSWRPPIGQIEHGIVESNWLNTPPSETPSSSIAYRPPIGQIEHGIVESNLLNTPPSETPSTSIAYRPPIGQIEHGIVESNLLSQNPSATPKPSPTSTTSQTPSIFSRDPKSPCNLENMAKQAEESLNEAKKHFEEMSDSESFIGSLGGEILRPEILTNFCKNPNMDLSEFINFHVTEACDAANTGSSRCREKIGKLLACDDNVWKELEEYGINRENIRNICNGGKTKEELNKITQNCLDSWEKNKEEFLQGLHIFLRAKCPPKEPTPPPIIPGPRPTPRIPTEPTLPPTIPDPVVAQCPPDMIKVGENKCACPEGKVMIDKQCKTCAESVPAGYSLQPSNYEAAVLAALNKERCVSGAKITLPGKAQRGPCIYYSTGEPQISVDRTPPICQSPCGPVKCDTSTSCPCPDKPNCTLRVTCNWGGWKSLGNYQYIPLIAFR